LTFELLAETPFESRASFRVKRLRDAGGRWVVRVGMYGAIYRVEGDAIKVLKVGPRSTLYRA
jgi:mRNA-degrading endonuclease RelE of RelBE toxin-antitoxin system